MTDKQYKVIDFETLCGMCSSTMLMGYRECWYGVKPGQVAPAATPIHCPIWQSLEVPSGCYIGGVAHVLNNTNIERSAALKVPTCDWPLDGDGIHYPICPGAHKELDGEFKFCPYCGGKIERESGNPMHSGLDDKEQP